LPCVVWSSRRTERVAARELLRGTMITDWSTVGDRTRLRSGGELS
jgi:hypothetical protein